MNINKSVFIITYGRSGSTLLQGILNSIDGYEIKGENMSALTPLFRTYKKAIQARYEHGKDNVSARDPWYGADSIIPREYAQQLVSVFINSILRPSPSANVIGFKEIRYGGVEFPNVDEANEYLNFIKNYFPNAYFIFNERNIDDTARSAWWADNPAAKQSIKDLLDRMKSMYAAHKDESFWVSYDEYKDDPSALSPLFEFLGENIDAKRLSLIMSKKHSY